MRTGLYNATLADLDPGERIQVTCSKCGRTSSLIVTYLVEKKKFSGIR